MTVLKEHKVLVDLEQMALKVQLEQTEHRELQVLAHKVPQVLMAHRVQMAHKELLALMEHKELLVLEHKELRV